MTVMYFTVDPRIPAMPGGVKTTPAPLNGNVAYRRDMWVYSPVRYKVHRFHNNPLEAP